MIPTTVPPQAAPSGDGAATPEPEGWVAPHIQARMWWAGGVVYRARYALIALVLLTGAITAAVSLTIPNRYIAETRLLLPEAGGGIGSLLDAVAPGASAILGKGSGNYTRYLAILTSRTMFEDAVDRFGLVEAYELDQMEHPRDAALREFGQRTTFEVSLDYDYLAVKVLDEDPVQAARIANYLIERLNERHITMSAGSASENRLFVEERLREAEFALDSAQADLQRFQERSGLIEIETQASALMNALGQAQGQIAQAEVQYEALRSQLGDENPDVQSARAALASARASRERLSGGGDAVLPVPVERLPALGREYAQIYQELRTQEEILRVIRPLFEQSVLAERREASAVQVLDPAVPPQRKAEPRRSLMVLSAMVGAGTLLVLLLLAVSGWRQQREHVLARLRAVAR